MRMLSRARLFAPALGLMVSVSTVNVGHAQQVDKSSSTTVQDAAVDPPKPDSPKEEDSSTVPAKVVPEKEAFKQIVGNYRIVSGQSHGEQILPERLADVTVMITEQTITTYDKEKQERYKTSYRLDTQMRPWRIRMIPTEVPKSVAQQDDKSSVKDGGTDGLIELTSEGAKLVYALPGGASPTAFKAGANQNMFVLQRLKDVSTPPRKSGANEKNPQKSEPTKKASDKGAAEKRSAEKAE